MSYESETARAFWRNQDRQPDVTPFPDDPSYDGSDDEPEPEQCQNCRVVITDGQRIRAQCPHCGFAASANHRAP